MLPFDNRPWAKKVAALVIVVSIAITVVSLLYLRSQGPLDTGEFWVAALFLFASIPPNLAILLRKRSSEPPARVTLHTAH